MYGRFKTFDEIKNLVAPDAHAVEEVLTFFAGIEVPATVNPGGDYVDVDIPAGRPT